MPVGYSTGIFIIKAASLIRRLSAAGKDKKLQKRAGCATFFWQKTPLCFLPLLRCLWIKNLTNGLLLQALLYVEKATVFLQDMLCGLRFYFTITSPFSYATVTCRVAGVSINGRRYRDLSCDCSFKQYLSHFS